VNSLQASTSLRQKVLSGLAWSAGLKILGQLLTWSITIVVIRTLTPQDYGLMGMAGVAITYVATVNELGLGAALIQNKDLNDNTIRQIFGLLLILNIGLFLACCLLAPIISSFFNEDRLVPLIRLLATQFFLASFTIIPQSLIVREMLFKQKSIVSLTAAILGSLATLALALGGYGVWSLVWGSIVMNMFRTVGLNLIRPYFRLPNFSFKGMRKSISFGGYVTLTRILWLFYSKSDVLIVGKVLGKQLLGFYSVAMTLASLPMEKVSGIINQVAFPAFSTVQGDTKQAANHFLKSVRVMSFLAFPVLWGISSVAPQLVELLLGRRWDMAIIPLQILSLVIPIRMVSNLMSPALLGLGRPDVNLYNVITASLFLPLGFLIGSHWGIVGVSLSWAIIFPIVFLINLFRLTRFLKIGILDVMSAMSKPFLASVAMLTLVSTISVLVSEFDPTLRLVLPVMGGAAVYCGITFFLNLDGYHEVLGLLRSRS
jgi:teichuronic acid exporter